jgi:hypothetical protein
MRTRQVCDIAYICFVETTFSRLTTNQRSGKRGRPRFMLSKFWNGRRQGRIRPSVRLRKAVSRAGLGHARLVDQSASVASRRSGCRGVAPRDGLRLLLRHPRLARAVAGGFHDAPMAFGDLWIEKLAPQRFEAFERAFLVRPHQPRIPPPHRRRGSRRDVGSGLCRLTGGQAQTR